MPGIGFFGAGTIGGGVANLVNALDLTDRMVLYDSNKPLLNAQRLDLIHTGKETEISTNPDEIASCDIVVCTAGLPRNPNVKTRAALLDVNLPIATECSTYLNGFEGILITVTNPMDVINYSFSQNTDIPRERIIGFGGQLDSARLRYTLRKNGLDSSGIILGEHGEHQVPTLNKPIGVSDQVREDLLTELRGSSMEIIKGKGATQFGPTWHITNLIRLIQEDARTTIPCSCVLDGEYGYSECSLGVPAEIGREGIRKIEEINLDTWEQNKMNDAAAFLSDLCRGLK